MGWDDTGASAGAREPAKHRKLRRQRAAAKTVLRTAASLLRDHHGSSVPAVVEDHLGMSTRHATGQSGDWQCKWCTGSDGSPFRNNKERKNCFRCNVAKSYAFKHPNSGDVRKPSTSLAERQVLAEKTENRKQLQAQKRRIEFLEK